MSAILFPFCNNFFHKPVSNSVVNTTFEYLFQLKHLYFLFTNIQIIFTMQFVADHYRNYSQYVQREIRMRKQEWDWRSQFYALTRNPELGQKLPCYVKFPKLHSDLEKIPRNHPWANHRQGKYNGLYFIPTEEKVLNVTIKDVTIGEKNITANYFNTASFNLLGKGFEYMYEKLDPDTRPGSFVMVNENYNIATAKGPELLQQSKYNFFTKQFI